MNYVYGVEFVEVDPVFALSTAYFHGYNDPTAFHVPILWNRRAVYLMSGQPRFNASGTGGIYSPSPSRAYGTRIRSLRSFWGRP
jgi:hypothetical protein